MNGISASKLFFGLNQAKSIERKLNNFISKKDTNGDNTLSIRELGARKGVFDRIDKNGDGQASKFELIIAAHKRAHAGNEKANQLISKKDTNGDGVLNIGEFGAPEKAFNRIDKNGDGQIGSGELNVAARDRAHAGNGRIKHLISNKDINGDGVLNAGELGVSGKAFNRIDKNGDGQIGRRELKVAARNRIHAVNERISHLMSKKDSNGDGALDVGELGVSKDVFDRIDKNGNGKVGRRELKIASRNLARAAFNTGTTDPELPYAILDQTGEKKPDNPVVLPYPIFEQTEQKPSFAEYSSLDSMV